MSGGKKTSSIFDFLNKRVEDNKAKSGYQNIIEPFEIENPTLDNEELQSSQNTDNVSPEILDYLKISSNERKATSYALSEEAKEAALEDKVAFETTENSIKDLDSQEKALKENKDNYTLVTDPISGKSVSPIPVLKSEAAQQLEMIKEQKKQLALTVKDNANLESINKEIKKLEDPFLWDGASTDTKFFSNPFKWIDESISNTFANVHNVFVNPENKMKPEDKIKYQKLKAQRDTFYKPIAEAKAYDWELISMNLDMQLSDTNLSLPERWKIKNLKDQAVDKKRELEAYVNGEDGADAFFRKLGGVTMRTNEEGTYRPYSDLVDNVFNFAFKDDLYNRASEQGFENLSEQEKGLLEVYGKIDEDSAFLSDKQKWSYNTVDSTMHSVGFIRDMIVGGQVAKGLGAAVGLGEGTALAAATKTLRATGSKLAGRVAASGVKAGNLATSFAIQNQMNPQFINQELMKGSHIERDEQGNITNIYVKDKLYDYMSEVYKQTAHVYTAEKNKLESKQELTQEEQARLSYLKIKLGEENSLAEHSLNEELATFKPASILEAETLGFAHTATENLAELYGMKILGGIGKGLNKIPGVNKLTTGIQGVANKIDYKFTGTKLGRFYKNLNNATGKLNVNGARVIGSMPEEIAEEYVTAGMNSIVAADPKEFIDMFDTQANIDIAAQTLLMSAGFGLGGNVQTYAKLGYNNLITKRIEDLKNQESEALIRLPQLDKLIQSKTPSEEYKGTPEYNKAIEEVNELKAEKVKQEAVLERVTKYRETPSLTGLNIMSRLPGVTDSTFSGTRNYIESRTAIRNTIDALKTANPEKINDIINLNSVDGFGISEQKLKINSLKAQGKTKEAELAEKAMFQNLVVQSFRGGIQDEFKKALDKLEASPNVDTQTKLQILKAKTQMESLSKTYDLNKSKPNISNIMTLAMEKLSAKDGISDIELEQNNISNEVREEIEAFRQANNITVDYSLDTLFTREFDNQADQDKYDAFVEKLSNYTNTIVETYLGLDNAKQTLKAHLNNTALALSEAIHPSIETINKGKFLDAVTEEYNKVLSGEGNIASAKFNFNNEFKPTKKFIEDLFESKKSDWVGNTTQGKISEQTFQDLKAKAIFNVTRELIKEKIIQAQAAQEAINTANQEVVVQDTLDFTEDIVITDAQAETEFIDFSNVIEQDTFIFFDNPQNNAPIIDFNDLDSMIENEQYTPEQLAFVKKAMYDVVTKIKEITGQDKVSFKEAVSQYYKYFENKEVLKNNFRHFARGWKENNFEVSNAEIMNAFDSLFLKESDIMKVEEGIINLFEKTVVPEIAPVLDLEEKTAKTQEVIVQDSLFIVAYDEENLPVSANAIEEIKTQRTVNNLPKLGFNAIAYEEVIEEGVLIRKATASSLNLKDTDLIDFRDLLNPDMYYSGTTLGIQIADESLWSQINVSNGRDEKGNVKIVPFSEWAKDKDRDSKEFKDKMPIFFVDEKGKKLAYVQDVDWYNPYNVANPYGESNDPNNPTEQWQNHINEGKENTSKFRDSIARGLTKVTVERLTPEGVFHKLLDEEPLITLQESNPSSIITVQKGETLENLPAEFASGESILLNKSSDFDINRTNGHTWTVYRIGTVRNDKGDLVKTYRAFPINRQVTLEQVENVRWALAAFSAYSGNSLPSKFRMTKEQALENFIKPINKLTGINISDVKGLMEYVKAHFQLTPNAIYGLRRPTDTKAYNTDSVILYLRLLLEDNSKLEDPTVVELLSQHTNSKLLTTRFNAVNISREGVTPRLRDGKTMSYEDYLKDTLLINIKAFNVGTEAKPVYATSVQPIINISYEEVTQAVPSIAERVREATVEAIESVSETTPTLADHLDFFNSIGVDIEAFEDLDNLIENVDKFKNLFNLTGNLNVVQEKTLRQFIVHAIGEKIDFNYKTKISRDKVSKEVKSEVALQLRIVEAKAKKLSENINVPEDKKALIEAAYNSVIENIKSIQSNFTTIFDKAFEDIKKQTQLTEIEEEEREIEDESLTVKDYTKESIEEGGKSKASYRLRRFLHKIPKYDAQGNIITGYLGFTEYMTFNDVYNELTRVLSLGSEVSSDYKTILEKLKRSEAPFVKDIVKKLETADQQIKNELVYNFVRHSLSSKFAMFESTTLGTSLKIYDTNANEINRIILNKWINENKASNLYLADGSFNVEYAKSLLESFKAFDKEVSNVDTNQLKNWLEQIGMYMHPKTWETLISKGLYNGNKQYSFKELYSLNKGGLFVPIVKFLEQGIATPENYSFTRENQVFYDLRGVTNAIANIEANYNPQLVALSYRDSGKNISTQVPTKFFTDKIEELKRSLNGSNTLIQDLKSLSFSEDSIILELLENDPTFKNHFEASHISLTALKEKGKNPSKAGLTDLGEVDYDMLTLTGFMDRKVGNLSPEFKIEGISMRLAHMLVPTMSDKSTGLFVKTGVLDLMKDSALLFNKNEDGSLSLDPSLKEVLFKYLVLPELKRIIKFHSQVKSTNIKNYDKAATLFHLIPVMNTLKGESGMSIIEELAVTENYTLQNIIDKYQGTFEDAITKVVTAEVEDKKRAWKSFVEETEAGPISQMFDTNYFKEVDKVPAENYDIAIYDYVINSMIFNADVFKVFAGDIANYSQDKVFKGEDNIYDIKEPTKYISINKQIGVNLGKRLALLIAPGSKMANSYGEKYNQIMLQDSVDITENANYLISMYYGKDALDIAEPLLLKYSKAASLINRQEQGTITISPEKLEKIKAIKNDTRTSLAKAYPLLTGYFDIESTDAQEYTTVSEHVENLYRMGRLSDNQYQTILDKVNTNSPLSKKELKVVLQPMKPVYTGTHINKEWDINRVVYIKSSSFPLLPQFTSGTKLDALRVKMEELESKTGRFTRASFQTANKVGATKNVVNPFDVNSLEKIKEYSETDLDSVVLVLSRDNFRNQQDVPFKSDKKSDDKVSMGTQFFKLLFGDGIVNEQGFVLDSNTLTGKQLYEKYTKAFETIVNSKKQELFLDLGLSASGEVLNQAVFVTKLQNLLTKEATDRGYSIKSLRGLKIEKLAAKAGYYYEFKTPLWLSSDSNRYESLLNSIITNRIMKHKMPGNGFVAGSESGLTMKEDLQGINKSEIIYLDKWNGVELQGTKNENGVFSKAQVFMPSKFKHNKELVDLFEDYSVSKGEGKYIIRNDKGQLSLKPGMISEELLNNFSFRTPTSSHVSGSSIEIVGFLPAEMGDLMIVPKNFTKQKGLDFDVDKEYTYQLNHIMNEDGSFEALQLKHKEEIINSLQYIIDKLDLENIVLDRKGSYRAELLKLSQGKGNFFDEESLEELLVPDMSVKEKLERKTLEIDRKLAENEFIKIHLAVFNNPSNNVQSKINKILSIDFAKEQADKFEALNEEGKKNAQIQKYLEQDASLSLLDAETKYKEESLNFNMLNYTYQKDKMSLGSIGKIAIGVYANYTTFNGLIQQSEASQFIPIVVEKGIFTNKEITIGNYTSSGILGAEKTLDGERTIAEVFAEKENTATDNEKEQVLGRVGVDEFTINTDALMSLRGFDKDENGNSISYLLLSQPIVKKLNSFRKNSRGTLGQYQPDEDIINNLLFELTNGQLFWAEGKAVYANSISLELDAPPPVPYEIQGKVLKGAALIEGISSNGNDKAIQLEALLTYLELEKEAKGISKIQKTINVNTLGKSMIESQLKYQGLKELANNPALAGASALLGDFIEITEDSNLPDGYYEIGDFYVKPTTPQGQIVINGLYLGNTLYNDFFPYQEQAILSAINEILVAQDKTELSDNALVDQFETIVEEFRKYIYSRENNNIFEGEARQKRFELFKDTDVNTSLSTYLKELLKGEVSAFGKGIKAVRANALVKSFNFETGKGANELSLIKYNNAATDNLDEESLYNAIPELILLNAPLPERNGKPYNTRLLAEDLVNYAYLEGGIQEANQFIKFVPVEYLESVGKYEDVYFYKEGKVVKEKQFVPANRKFQEFNSKRNATIFEDSFGFNENGPSNFTKQYFQHNPTKAIRTSFKDIKNYNPKEGTFTLKIAYSTPSYLSLKNSSKNVDKYSLFQHIGNGNYKKLNLLGQMGISEYEYGKSEAASLRDTEVVKVEPIIGQVNTSTKSLEINQNTTIKDFLTDISQAALSPEFEHLKLAASTLKPFAKEKGQILVTPDIPGAGGANKRTGDISLHSTLAFTSDNKLAMTFMHEFVHTLSRNELDKYFDAKGDKLRTDVTIPSYVTDLFTVFNKFRKLHSLEIETLRSKIKSASEDSLGVDYTEREKDLIYAGINIREFLAVSLTSPLFQNEMGKVPYEFSGKSLLEKVLDIIMKLMSTAYSDITQDSLAYASVEQSLRFIAEENVENSRPDVVISTPNLSIIDQNDGINFGPLDINPEDVGPTIFDLSIDNLENIEEDVLTLPDCI